MEMRWPDGRLVDVDALWGTMPTIEHSTMDGRPCLRIGGGQRDAVVHVDGPLIPKSPEAATTASGALDAPFRRRGWKRSTTLRSVLGGSRAPGLDPGKDRRDQDVADRITRAGADARARRAAALRQDSLPRGFAGGGPPDSRGLPRGWGGGASQPVDPLQWLNLESGLLASTVTIGLAEGMYPREAANPSDPQGMLAAEIGTYADMANDVADMGAGVLRRFVCRDVMWGALFPADLETGVLSAAFFDYGMMVKTPAAIIADLEADTYGGLAATEELLRLCLARGVKVNLSPFNRGGGSRVNWNLHGAVDGQLAADDPALEGRPPGAPWVRVANGRPSWQRGMLVPSAEGWDPWYWDHSGVGDTDVRAYQRYAVCVWPTRELGTGGRLGTSTVASPPGDAGYWRECARRKSLAVAAFATGIARWLVRLDATLRADSGARITDVVNAIELCNELDQFWMTRIDTDSADALGELRASQLEVGHYFALLAGPIRAALPTMRFRAEIASWGTVDERPINGYFPETTDWLAAVIQTGMTDALTWWKSVQTESRSTSPSDDVVDWLATCAGAGFSWPPESASDAEDLAFALWDLVHETGFHWYHGYDTYGGSAGFNSDLYVGALQQAADVQAFDAALRAVLPSVTVTMGEVGFPSVDPNPDQIELPGLDSNYYSGTNPAFEAGMLIRLLALNVAYDVTSSCWFTFCEPYQSGTDAWTPTSGTGLHSEDYSGATYVQGTDGYQKPAWFAFRRLRQLLANTDAVTALTNEAGLVVLRFALSPSVPYAYAYLFWLDQYEGTSDKANVDFGDEGFVYFPLVPTVDGPSAPLDDNGYPRATEESGTLVWPEGAPSAVLNELLLPNGRRFTIQRADPALAPEPVCILSDAEPYDGAGTWSGNPLAGVVGVGEAFSDRVGDGIDFVDPPSLGPGPYVPREWQKLPLVWR